MIDHAERRSNTIESHRYLCSRAARKFVRRGVDRADLEQVAAIGLIKAVDRYDSTAGTPLEAYAWVFILGELMHYVRDCERVLRAPRRLRELERRWLVAERELCALLGRDPRDAEIGEYLGVKANEQNDLQKYRSSGAVLSMEALRPHEHHALSYTIESSIDRLIIDESLALLSPLEREILAEVYERDTPIAEIASRLGYSRRHVTRLHREALKKLAPLARPHAV